MFFTENAERLRTYLISFYDTVNYHREIDPKIGIGQIADGFIKNQIDCENGMKSYFDAVTEIAKKNTRILRAIKTVKGKTFCRHLTEFIKDREAVDYAQWEIISEPEGVDQEVSEYGREIKKEWVQQWATGTEGDTWDGIICVKIKANKYLKFHYSM